LILPLAERPPRKCVVAEHRRRYLPLGRRYGLITAHHVTAGAHHDVIGRKDHLSRLTHDRDAYDDEFTLSPRYERRSQEPKYVAILIDMVMCFSHVSVAA